MPIIPKPIFIHNAEYNRTLMINWLNQMNAKKVIPFLSLAVGSNDQFEMFIDGGLNKDQLIFMLEMTLNLMKKDLIEKTKADGNKSN